MTTKISPISFKGIKVEGIISAKNIKNFCEFTNSTEKIRFIEDIEKTLNTDVVIKGNLDKIRFSHNVYGDLTKYKCPVFTLKDFPSRVDDLISDIKLSIKRAERSFKKEEQKYRSFLRGC